MTANGSEGPPILFGRNRPYSHQRKWPITLTQHLRGVSLTNTRTAHHFPRHHHLRPPGSPHGGPLLYRRVLRVRLRR